jgi:SAM-dependent methyltransferase
MSATTTNMAPEMEALKGRLKAIWESGDYGVFAKYLEPGALEFFDRLDIPPGTKLLDIGCGAGQLTIPAAKKGIDVTAVDLAQNLVDQAKDRAKAEGLDVRIEQGDAEALAFPDSSFDMSLSLIGSMFAPRPELVASEMVRVTRPGGKIIMGNWTPAGHVGQMFNVIGKHAPPPSIFPSPLLWGDEAKVRERFAKGVSDLKITSYMYPMRYPFPPAEVVDFFITYYGPTFRAHASLDEAGKEAFRNDLTDLWTRNNTATDGTTDVQSEYIEVIGTRA